MLALLVVAALAQTGPEAEAPSVAVYLRPAPGLKPSLRDAVLAAVRSELSDAGFPPAVDARDADRRLRRSRVAPCPSGVECLVRIARELDVDVVVAVDATEFEGDMAVALEAADARTERRITRHSVVVRSRDLARRLREELEPFTDALRAALSPPPRSDAPLAVKRPPPPPTPEPALLAPAPPPGRSRTPALVATSGAALTGAAAIFFGVSGLSYRAEALAHDANGISGGTWDDATRNANRSSRDLSLSVVSLGATAALTTAAILLWPKETSTLGLKPRQDR